MLLTYFYQVYWYSYPLTTSVSLRIGKCRVELAPNNLLHFSFSASYLLIAASLELPFPDLSAASCCHVTMSVVNGMWVIHGMSAAFFEKLAILPSISFPYIMHWNRHMIGLGLFILKAELGNNQETLEKQD